MIDSATTTRKEMRERSVHALVWTIVGRWGSHGISLTVFVILATLLEPRDFGLLALTAALLDFLDLFLDQGFASAIVQREKLEPEHLDTAFWICLQIGIGLAVINLALSPVIAAVFNEPSLFAINAVLSLKFVLRGLNGTQAAILKRRFDFKQLAVRTTVPLLVGGAVAIVMAYRGYGVWSLVTQQLVAATLSVCILWKVGSWRPRFRMSASHWKDLFSFGVNMTGFRLVTYFGRHADDVIIGYVLGPVALGFYSVAYRVLRALMAILIGIIESVALPTFSRLQTVRDDFKSVYLTVCRLTSLVSFPVFVSIAVLAPDLTVLLFGEKWLPSAPVMRLLALGGLAESLGSIQGTALVASGNPRVRFKLALFRSLIMVGGFAIGVRWGIEAVALSFLITTALITPVMYAWAINPLMHLTWRSFLSPYATPLLASSLMALTLIGTRQILFVGSDPRIAPVLSVAIAGAVYVAVVSSIAPHLIRQAVGLVQVAMPQRRAGRAA